MRADWEPSGPNLLDEAILRLASAALAERLRFLDEECERAWELTAPERRLHLVIVSYPMLSGIPDAVACSWPLPPARARRVETVPTRGFL